MVRYFYIALFIHNDIFNNFDPPRTVEANPMMKLFAFRGEEVLDATLIRCSKVRDFNIMSVRSSHQVLHATVEDGIPFEAASAAIVGCFAVSACTLTVAKSSKEVVQIEVPPMSLWWAEEGAVGCTQGTRGWWFAAVRQASAK